MLRTWLWDWRRPSLVACVLILGGIGFSAGFFGPMVFDPSANQGPLVGILISGPLGVVLSLVLFVGFRVAGVSPTMQWRTLGAFGAALGLVTVYLILPGPELHGYIEEVQIDSCKRPTDVTDEAIQYWGKQIASRPSAARIGWQEDSREMLRDDDGVILTVTIVRQRAILEAQKPWNKGHLIATVWQPVDMQKSYYAKYAGSACESYGAGRATQLFNNQYFDGYPHNLGWPPRRLVNFLNLQTLESVPAKYSSFLNN